MKVLSKLKLNVLSKEELKEREMNNLFGGGTPGNCRCGCEYNNTDNNGGSNSEQGYTITGGWGDSNDSCSCADKYSLASYKSDGPGVLCICTQPFLSVSSTEQN